MKNDDDGCCCWEIWLERYRLSLALESYAARTIQGRLEALSKFVKWCHDLGIESPDRLTLDLVSEYRRYRIERVNAFGRRDGPATVNNTHLMALRHFFGFLAQRGLVPGSAAIESALKYLKVPKLLPLYTPVHAQVMKMIECLPSDSPVNLRDRAILEILYSSAIRRNELAHLTLSDLDLTSGVLPIRCGKGAKDRVVPLGVHAAEWVRRYVQFARPALMQGRDEHGFLFVSRSGRPISGIAVFHVVRRWARAAGIEKAVGPHALRRSCATELIKGGASLGHVKDILGHESYASLDKYVRLVIVDLQEALRKFHPRELGDKC